MGLIRPVSPDNGVLEDRTCLGEDARHRVRREALLAQFGQEIRQVFRTDRLNASATQVRCQVRPVALAVQLWDSLTPLTGLNEPVDHREELLGHVAEGDVRWGCDFAPD